MARHSKERGAEKSRSPIQRKVLLARATEDLARYIAVVAEARGVGISDVIREVLELYSRGRRLRPESAKLKHPTDE
jgi:hypothetical protein